MFQVDEASIDHVLSKNQIHSDHYHIREILSRGRELKGISAKDVVTLLHCHEPDLVSEIFDTASFIKNEIYGKRLVLFAPLYISNFCANECSYCAFRKDNNELHRKALAKNELEVEVKELINSGHKRLLLVAGEDYRSQSFERTLESIDEIYNVKTNKGKINRVNVNIAPTTVTNYKRLSEKKIGTYQIFQETYNKKRYKEVHLSGPKSNYEFRLDAISRAIEGGIQDVGVGILFGLHDYRYEILALFQHIEYLEKRFGIGPHTISVPRLEPAIGSPLSNAPLSPLSDQEFLKIISILRIAVPYTGIILSTRENPEIRRRGFNLGVSQISAGSKTSPGKTEGGEQFSLGDHRSLLEVVKDMVKCNHIPSFCTGCYRKNRVGSDFMDQAKVGLIKNHCLPNGIFSFLEYLNDFADDELRKDGYELIHRIKNEESIPSKMKSLIDQKIGLINGGERDIYF